MNKTVATLVPDRFQPDRCAVFRLPNHRQDL
jgi:hypothetical protein